MQTKTRVKVYELDEQSQWIDKGTGYVHIIYVEAKESLCIIVKPEEGDGLVMNSTIKPELDTYSRQQETLIVWSEPDGTDLALSFQEVSGCEDIWNQISDGQKRLIADKHNIDQMPMSTDALLTEDFKVENFDIPDPTIRNIKDIEILILNVSKNYPGRNKLIDYITKSAFIEKLLPLLEEFEDFEYSDELYSLSIIIRSIILLNDAAIYEIILRDENFVPVVGILEYDREFPQIKATFRRHLTESAKFKQVIPIENPDIVTKINQIYRVQFLKDVALARLLDDQTFSSLTSIAYFNQAEVISYIQSNQTFLQQIFNILSEEGISLERRKDVILFLHELSTVVKSIQITNKSDFFRSLAQHGLFAIFEYTLGDTDTDIRIAVISILTCILEGEAPLVRSFCVAQIKQGQKPLFDLVVERFLVETESGLRSQLSEVIRMMIDTTRPSDASEGLVQNAAESEEFLLLFYETALGALASPILNLNESNLVDDILPLNPEQAETCHYICELLCFMVKHHQYKSKFFFMGDIAKKLLLLLKAKSSYIRLSALRVYRAVIGTMDDFYFHVILKTEALQHILKTFFDTKNKNNLLNSACLELLEFIAKQNLKPLISNIVTRKKDFFDDSNSSSLFNTLMQKYKENMEKNMEDLTECVSGNNSHMKNDGWSRTDQNEDAYFSSIEEDEPEPQRIEVAKANAPPPLRNVSEIDEDDQLVRKSSIKPVKLSISLSTDRKDISLDRKGLVGELSKKSLDTIEPIEFVRSTMDVSFEQSDMNIEEHALKKHKAL